MNLRNNHTPQASYLKKKSPKLPLSKDSNSEQTLRPPNNIDSFLSRASHASQIILVIVAIFGYFYTVRPIYQKDLLAEDVSRLTKKSSELDTTIAEKNVEINTLNTTINNLTSEKETLRLTLTKMAEEIEKISKDKDTLAANIQQLNGEREDLLQINKDLSSKTKTLNAEKTRLEKTTAHLNTQMKLSATQLTTKSNELSNSRCKHFLTKLQMNISTTIATYRQNLLTLVVSMNPTLTDTILTPNALLRQAVNSWRAEVKNELTASPDHDFEYISKSIDESLSNNPKTLMTNFNEKEYSLLMSKIAELNHAENNAYTVKQYKDKSVEKNAILKSLFSSVDAHIQYSGIIIVEVISTITLK